jgi:DNA modification methylase
VPQELKDSSRVDLKDWLGKEWHLSVWEITNVLPTKKRLETGIAAFPEEIPCRLIKLFSHRNETVLDPFTEAATTLKVAVGWGETRWATMWTLDSWRL